MAVRAGNYELGSSLRRDEYGEVFSARGGKVQVRVVPRTFACAPRAEASLAAASKVRHPTLATIVAFGRTSTDELYIASTEARGVSLATWIRDEGKLAPTEALRIVRTVAEAASALHESGVVHGRIDPTRVLVERCEDGARTTLVDVGLGAIIGDEAEEARTTLPDMRDDASFLSPEQAAGEDALAPECDVWALGALLHFCVTGEPPFGTSSRAKLMVETARRAPRISTVDRRTNAIVARCLAREPALRPTTRELIDDLRDAAEGHSSPELMGELTGVARETHDPVAPTSTPLRDLRALQIVFAFVLAVGVGVGVGAVRAHVERAAHVHAAVAQPHFEEQHAIVSPPIATPRASTETVSMETVKAPPPRAPATAPAVASAAVPKPTSTASKWRAKVKPKEPDPFFGVTTAGF